MGEKVGPAINPGCSSGTPPKPNTFNSATADAKKRLDAEERALQTKMKSASPEARVDYRDTLKEIQQAKKDLAPPACPTVTPAQSPTATPAKPNPTATPTTPAKPSPTTTPTPPVSATPTAPPAQPNSPVQPNSPLPPVGSPYPGGQPPWTSGGGANNGPNSGGSGASGTGNAAPVPFNTATDPVVDISKWVKEGLFAFRAFGRVPLEGWDTKGGLLASANKQLEALQAAHPPGTPPTQQILAAEARLATLTKLANYTKLVGLGGFSIAANVQKGAEIYNYWTSGDGGDKFRAGASSSEFLNNIRLGITGITPFLAEGSAFQQFAKNYMGGTFGTKLGVGANVVAGGFRMGGVVADYQRDYAAATNAYGQDKAYTTAWEKGGGVVLDTANDIYPYVAGMEPLAWSSWLVGKFADHGAQSMLEGSGYKPVSIGAEWSRNLSPLFTGVNDLLGIPGLPTTTPLRDLSLPMSYDGQVVAQFDNRINYAAGIGSGVTDVTVKVGGAAAIAYFSGGAAPPSVYYAAAQLDHTARQGLNVWTDLYWQRPQERAAAVQAAGLDPALDTRQVVHQQPDFLHRIWAEASANFNRGFLDTREELGNNNAVEQRWLELDKTYTNPAISDDTARTSNEWYVQMFSPESVANVYSYVIPGSKPVVEVLKPENIGVAAAYVEEGWNVTTSAISSAATATADTAVYVWNNPGEAAGRAADATVDAAGSAWNATTGAIGDAWNWAWN